MTFVEVNIKTPMPRLTDVWSSFRRDEAQQSSVPQQRDQEEHDLQGLKAPQTQQQARSQPGNPPPGMSLMPVALCHVC